MGLLYRNDAVHSYMYATQSGVNPYKADGTSNLTILHLQERHGMVLLTGQNDLKIQPATLRVFWYISVQPSGMIKW